MSTDSGKYDFCPKCGALAKDGVCQSCGHRMTDKNNRPGEQQADGSDSYQPGNLYGSEPGQNYNNQPGVSSGGQYSQSYENQPGVSNGGQFDQGGNSQTGAGGGQYSQDYNSQSGAGEGGQYGQGYDSQSGGYGGQYGQGYDSQSGGYGGQYDQGYGSQSGGYGGQYGQNYNAQTGAGYGGQYGQDYGSQTGGYGGQYDQNYNTQQGGYDNAQYGQNYNGADPYGYSGNNPYGGYQGGQYGQGYGPYGQPNPYQVFPDDRKNKGTGIIIAISVIGGVFILGLIILATLMVGNRAAKAVSEETNQDDIIIPEDNYDYNDGYEEEPYYDPYEDPYYDPYEDPYGDPYGDYDYGDEYDEYGNKRGDATALPEGKEGATDPFLAEGYENSWGTNHKNVARDSFDAQASYYDSVVDSIDDSVPYKMNRKYYEYTSEDGKMTVQMAYYELEGDIPGLDKLNEEIYYQTAYLPQSVFSWEEVIIEEDYNCEVLASTDSYLTYNDEDKLSILLDERVTVSLDGESQELFMLHGINIDLKSGSVMDNSQILDIDEEFAVEFQERSAAQNGPDSGSMDELSDSEIYYYLLDPETNIIFYTPMGMEVGYNYETYDSIGWVTATYKDYEKYLNAL